MKKIIIIDHEPLSIRRKNIFYIDELLNSGFSVEFWDCSQYFHKGMLIVDSLCEKYIRKFDTFISISMELKTVDVDNTIFIIEVFDNWDNRKFFRLLADHHCYMVRQEMYATATLEEISILNKISRMSLLQFLDVCRNRINMQLYKYYKCYYHIYYDLKISSGNALDIDVHINHPDWELYKENKDEPTLIKTSYALFIDEFFPLHPDLIFFLHQQKGDASHYWQLLNQFFRDIEKKYNMEVIIAVHPKSNYDSDSFEGRTKIKYHTTELVRNAQMVFMHSSAALSFVMMFNKPLMLIATNDYMANRMLGDNLLRISHLTGLPIYNIEESNEINVQHLPICVRDTYIYNYLTSPGIENRQNIDILFDTYSKI